MTITNSNADPQSRSLSGRAVAIVTVAFGLIFAVYFSPAWIADALLAPGDGLNSYFPAVQRDWTLWNDELLIGFPSFADIQSMMFYPLRVLGPQYNVLVVSAYVIAAAGMYCFVRDVTGSSLAGFFSGAAFAMSGFMIAHLGHLTIIHTSCWLPWLLWSSRRVVESPAPGCVVALAGATALSVLGGHPQVGVYALALTGVYSVCHILGSAGANLRDRMTATLRIGIGFASGLAIASVQVVPFAELAALGTRREWSFSEFATYSLAPRDLLMLFVPNIYGSVGGSYYPYFGPWNLTELACYVGIAPLLLALTATVSVRSIETCFWVVAAMVSLGLALGGSTPLGSLLYHVPVFGTFRAQARFVLATTAAVCVLAGIAIAAAQSGRITAHARRVSLFLGALALAAVAVWVTAAYPELVSRAVAVGLNLPSISHNPAIRVAALLTVASFAAVAIALQRRSGGVWVAMFGLIVIDLASFGWMYEWRTGAIPRSRLDLPPLTAAVATQASRDAGRIWYPPGGAGAVTPFAPNLNQHYRVSVAGHYGPMFPRAYQELTGMDGSGYYADNAPNQPWVRAARIGWIVDRSRDLFVGSGCGVEAASGLRSRYAVPVGADRLRLVSHLGCSTGLAQGSPVLEVALDTRDTHHRRVLAAGIDTAEWAIARDDVKSIVKHGAARIAESFDAGGFPGHWYVAELALPDERPTEVVLTGLSEPGAILRIRSIEWVDDDSGQHGPVPLGSFAEPSSEWSDPEPLEADLWMRRRTAPAPHAWLVSDVRSIPRDAAVAAMRSGRLPDGKPFSPDVTALVEAPLDGFDQTSPLDTNVVPVRIDAHTPGHWRFGVKSPGRALLVVSQLDYPGWRASVDGEPASIVRVGGVFQGIPVPAAARTVTLDFAPTSLRVGVALAGAGILLLIGYSWFARSAHHSSSRSSP